MQVAYQSKMRQTLLSFRFISPIKEVRKFWRFCVFEARGSNSLYFSSVKLLELIVFWDKTFPSVRENNWLKMSKTDAENMLKGGFKNGLLECGKEPCNCFLSCCLAPYAIGENYINYFKYKHYEISIRKSVNYFKPFILDINFLNFN